MYGPGYIPYRTDENHMCARKPASKLSRNDEAWEKIKFFYDTYEAGTRAFQQAPDFRHHDRLEIAGQLIGQEKEYKDFMVEWYGPKFDEFMAQEHIQVHITEYARKIRPMIIELEEARTAKRKREIRQELQEIAKWIFGIIFSEFVKYGTRHALHYTKKVAWETLGWLTGKWEKDDLIRFTAYTTVFTDYFDKLRANGWGFEISGAGAALNAFLLPARESWRRWQRGVDSEVAEAKLNMAKKVSRLALSPSVEAFLEATGAVTTYSSTVITDVVVPEMVEKYTYASMAISNTIRPVVNSTKRALSRTAVRHKRATGIVGSLMKYGMMSVNPVARSQFMRTGKRNAHSKRASGPYIPRLTAEQQAVLNSDYFLRQGRNIRETLGLR